jgi:hypothetical protein
VNSVVFSPNGKRLASGGVDETIKVWDVATCRALVTFWGHTGSVWSVAYSPDGRTVASGSADKTIKLWDVPAAQEIKKESRVVRGGSFHDWALALRSAFRASKEPSDHQFSYGFRVAMTYTAGEAKQGAPPANAANVASDLAVQELKPRHTLKGHTDAQNLCWIAISSLRSF